MQIIQKLKKLQKNGTLRPEIVEFNMHLWDPFTVGFNYLHNKRLTVSRYLWTKAPGIYAGSDISRQLIPWPLLWYKDAPLSKAVCRGKRCILVALQLDRTSLDIRGWITCCLPQPCARWAWGVCRNSPIRFNDKFIAKYGCFL